MTNLYDIEVTTIDGQTVQLDAFRGQILLIVNVASRCGFTPQYADLETLYRRCQSVGMSVLGFPCNQFGRQEPGDEAEIKEFCASQYNVTFPIFAKIRVNGPSAHPLYTYLKSARPGIFGSKSIKWNFTKFLIDRQGQVVRRYGPTARIATIERGVRLLLGEAPAPAQGEVAMPPATRPQKQSVR